MDNIKDLLGEEIKTEIKSLSALNSGTKEKSMAIDDLAKLYRLRIEETKNEAEVAEKQARREMEKEQSASDNSSHRRTAQLERDRLDEQVKERYFRRGLSRVIFIFQKFLQKKQGYTVYLNDISLHANTQPTIFNFP